MEDQNEPRHVSGLTTGLILSYVEREGGKSAVGEVLALAGMSEDADLLRDEGAWFDDGRRVDLFHAAADVLKDPNIARSIGRSALTHEVGLGLKLSLRAFGTPRLVYTNIARANSKFTSAYSMTLLRSGSESASIHNVRVIDGEGDPSDCDYNIGLLSAVPGLFGLPPAEVRHPSCVHDGDSECRYEVSWQPRHRTLAWVFAGIGALLAAVAIRPSLLPVAATFAVLTTILAALDLRHSRSGRIDHLQRRVKQETEASQLLMISLKELVSELNLDQVLKRATDHAHAAVGGAEFALIYRDNDGVRCRRETGPLRGRSEALEQWAVQLPDTGKPIKIDDLSQVPELAVYANDEARPLRSLCAAPLQVGGSLSGFLVALFTGTGGALPRDIVQLESYAALAAIALENAERYTEQKELATLDPLTSLLNHRQFHETMEVELERARRTGERFAVTVVDLDNFKSVNDTCGHARGDEVLKTVGDALRRVGRVPDFAFRIGGDEFAMILPSTNAEEAAEVVGRAVEVIAQADDLASASFGVSSWPDSGLDKDELIAAADLAMYEMKETNRDPHRTSEPQPQAQGREAGQVRSSL